MSKRVHQFFRLLDRHGNDPTRMQAAYALFDASADGPTPIIYLCPASGSRLRMGSWEEILAWSQAMSRRGIRPGRDPTF